MTDKTFNFWTSWLILANLFAVIAGILVAFFGNSIIFEPHNEGTRQLFFDGAAIPEQVLFMKNWLFGIIGGTMVGFHLLMIGIAHFAFRKKEKWAFGFLWLGLMSWFFIGSGISIYCGAYYNVYLINLGSMFLIAIPLLATIPVYTKR